MPTPSERLTRREFEFLADRLAVPDAIFEALTDGDDAEFRTVDEPIDSRIAVTERDVSEACEWLTQTLSRTGYKVSTVLSNATPLHLAVLRDAVEGSTYIAKCRDAIDYDSDAIEARKGLQAARRCVAKLNAAGFDVEAPE